MKVKANFFPNKIKYLYKFYFLEKEINVILNHGAEDAECYGECAARMLVAHQNEKPQLSISQVCIINKIIYNLIHNAIKTYIHIQGDSSNVVQ